jgi:mannose-6-phosphate isomerase class I
MCGFRRLEEIAVLLKKHPEFAACISEEAKLAVFPSSGEESQQKAFLQKLFSSFMSCPSEVSERNLKLLLIRMGGPSIDAGAPSIHDPLILRYSPLTPEFEVLILTVEAGEDLVMANAGVPAIIIVLEGNGQMDGAQLHPGQSFFWPANAPALHFKVADFRRGPLKVAVAQKISTLTVRRL